MGHDILRAGAIIIASAITADLIAATAFLIAATYFDGRERI